MSPIISEYEGLALFDKVINKPRITKDGFIFSFQQYLRSTTFNPLRINLISSLSSINYSYQQNEKLFIRIDEFSEVKLTPINESNVLSIFRRVGVDIS